MSQSIVDSRCRLHMMGDSVAGDIVSTVFFICLVPICAGQTTASSVVAGITKESFAVSLYQHQHTVQDLQRFQCQNARITNVVSNRILGVPSCKTCFQVFPDTGGMTDEHTLRFMPLSSIDYTQDQNYKVSLDCVDAEHVVKKQIAVHIRVEPNVPPHFIVFFRKESRLMSQLVRSGLDLSGHCHDSDVAKNGDYLTFTLINMVPRSTHFVLAPDGVIRVVGDLSKLCRSPIAFTVACKDRFGHQAAQSLTVELTVKDGNKRPKISGLNSWKEVREDTAEGTTLATFSLESAGNTPDCTLHSSTTALSQFFELHSELTPSNVTDETKDNGEDLQGEEKKEDEDVDDGGSGSGSTSSFSIKVKGTLNYEALQTSESNLTVTCTDSDCTSLAAFLYVRVIDVNEPVTLYPETITLNTYEGNISLNPKWTPVDEDGNDSASYTIIGGNTHGLFTIHPTTGVITSIAEYDVDQNINPTTAILTVQVKDKGHYTSTAKVTVNIRDINDNRPTFLATPVTGAGQSMTATISNCPTTLGLVVASVQATDRDSAFQGNNAITYHLTGGPFTVDGSGRIRVRGSIVKGGETHVLKVTASDAGQVPGVLSSSAPVTITVTVTECPTTTTIPTTSTTPTTTTTTMLEMTTGENSPDVWTENLLWILLSGILSLALLSAAMLMVWRYCCTSPLFSFGGNTAPWCGFCKDVCHPRKAVEPIETDPPETGQPPKCGNGKFWQEHFTDEDYTEKPDRDGIPSPAPADDSGPLQTSRWRHQSIEF